MSHPSPITVAKNWNTKMQVAGAALCALVDVIQAADFERLKCECTENGIGHILKIIGDSILESSHHVQQALFEVDPTPPD